MQAQCTVNTKVAFAVDRSGSMFDHRSFVISSFNKFLGEQRGCDGYVEASLVTFNDVVEIVHNSVPITEIPDLSERNYVTGGTTCLYDAIWAAIGCVDEEHPNEKDIRLVIIITDGLDNCSVASSPETREKVMQCKDKGIIFTWISQGCDAKAAGERLGIVNVAEFSDEPDSIEHVLRGISQGLTQLRLGSSQGDDWRDGISSFEESVRQSSQAPEPMEDDDLSLSMRH